MSYLGFWEEYNWSILVNMLQHDIDDMVHSSDKHVSRNGLEMLNCCCVCVLCVC